MSAFIKFLGWEDYRILYFVKFNKICKFANYGSGEKRITKTNR